LLEPASTVAEIAAEYVALIRQVRPHGPYLLAGYSFGGLLAYEAARLLREAGETVAEVILFDTDNPAVQPHWYSRWERLGARWALDSDMGFVSKLMNLGRRIFWGMKDRRRENAITSEIRLAMEKNRRAPESLRPQEVRMMYDDRMQAWKPFISDHPITLIRSTTPNDKFRHQSDLGWSGVVPAGVEIRDVTGQHLDIFKEPNVEILSHQVRQVLGRVTE
jgi:thioesterase domain-containing protein